MTLRLRARAGAGVLLVGAVLGGAGAVELAGPEAAHAASGRCSPGAGVTVVVDYGPLGGGVQIGCDRDGAGHPASEVVPDAGFPLTYVTTEPGFVCSVKGRPDPGTSCHRTPPSSAYWHLFWSDGSSSSWNHSNTGVGGLEVRDGGSIGWRFQNGGERERPRAAPTTDTQPSPSPSPRPKPSPTPKPSPKPSATAKPSATPRPSPSARPAQATSPATTSASASPRSQDAEASSAGAGKPSSTPGQRTGDAAKPVRRQREDRRPDQASRPGEDREERVRTSAGEAFSMDEPVTEPAAADSATGGGGAPAATVAALVLLAGLGSAAALVARRRRAGR